MNKFGIKNYKQKLEIIAYLQGLGSSKIDPDFCWSGICNNLCVGFNINGYRLVSDLSVTWIKKSGDPDFPVPLKYAPRWTTYEWDIQRQEGRDRRELCAHLARELKKN